MASRRIVVPSSYLYLFGCFNVWTSGCFSSCLRACLLLFLAAGPYVPAALATTETAQLTAPDKRTSPRGQGADPDAGLAVPESDARSLSSSALPPLGTELDPDCQRIGGGECSGGTNAGGACLVDSDCPGGGDCLTNAFNGTLRYRGDVFRMTRTAEVTAFSFALEFQGTTDLSFSVHRGDPANPDKYDPIYVSPVAQVVGTGQALYSSGQLIPPIELLMDEKYAIAVTWGNQNIRFFRDQRQYPVPFTDGDVLGLLGTTISAGPPVSSTDSLTLGTFTGAAYSMQLCLAPMPIDPPLAAPAPHDRSKNRYVSFVPNSPGTPGVAFKIDKTTAPVGTAWVGVPDANGMAPVENAPVIRVWPETVVHVGDCMIVPVATYEIRATADGGTFSSPLTVSTTAQPAPKFWGDTVGAFGTVVADEWDPPNGVVNVNDYVAALQKFLGDAAAPHVTVVDVQTVSSTDPCLNRVANIADVFLIIKAFYGNVYPFETAPANCPACP